MTQQPSEIDHTRYMMGLLTGVALLAVGAFSLNWLVDPLWFSNGNRLGDQNFIYNERVSKLNRFARSTALDCIVLGDSRVALLDANELRNGHCFNLAFAGGNLRDLDAYARYSASRELDLRRVVVGIGMFNFTSQPLPENSPSFVLELQPPPGPLGSYLSTEMLGFSLRTLFGRSPTPIYYDREFRARILRDSKDFDRNPAVREDNWSFFMHHGPFSDDRIPLLGHALDRLGDAERIGYVPPITARFILELEEHGTLDSYLASLYAASELFAVFIDFSIPSSITLDSKATFDGQHYYEEVNRRIVERLNGDAMDFGVDVKSLGEPAYRRQFLQAVEAARMATP